MWRIAWRNLWRNRTRSVIALTSIAFSFALLLVSFGTADATYRQTRRAAVRTVGGAVLVHGAGWWEERTSEILVPSGERVASSARAIPGVRSVVSRVVATGLLSSSRGNQGIELRGIVPAGESVLQDLSRWVTEGRFVDERDARPLVLGRSIADKLGLGLGDRVVFTTTDPAGEMTRALFRVRGLLESGSRSLDEAAAYTTLDAARAAVGLDEGAVTQVGLVLAPDADRAQVAAALRDRLSSEGNLEVLTWDEAMPELVGFIETDKAFSYIFGVLIFLVVGFGIANTFLMAVLERVRELGLQAALGLSPGGISRLILAETVVLAATGIGIGLAFGLAAHLYLARIGISIEGFSDSEMELSGVILEDMVIRSEIDPARWIGGAIGVLVVIVSSALYPAWRAGRLDPVEAMRTYE